MRASNRPKAAGGYEGRRQLISSGSRKPTITISNYLEANHLPPLA